MQKANFRLACVTQKNSLVLQPSAALKDVFFIPLKLKSSRMSRSQGEFEKHSDLFKSISISISISICDLKKEQSDEHIKQYAELLFVLTGLDCIDIPSCG